MRYLGIDWGLKRIGLALGDDETGLASPLGVVADLDGVLDAIAAEDVEALVLGRPVSLAGGTSVSDEYEFFRSELTESSVLELYEADERLTSRAADHLQGVRNEKAERDAIAAMLILQGFLDSRREGEPQLEYN